MFYLSLYFCFFFHSFFFSFETMFWYDLLYQSPKIPQLNRIHEQIPHIQTYPNWCFIVIETTVKCARGPNHLHQKLKTYQIFHIKTIENWPDPGTYRTVKMTIKMTVHCSVCVIKCKYTSTPRNRPRNPLRQFCFYDLVLYSYSILLYWIELNWIVRFYLLSWV